MRLATALALAALASPAATAHAKDALLEQARATFKPIPAAAPDLKRNPRSAPKVELGRMLYFDPRLSSSWSGAGVFPPWVRARRELSSQDPGRGSRHGTRE